MIRKKQSQIISYLRKNKLIFLLSFFFLALISSGTQAAMVDLTYKPNVPIPIEVGGIDFGGTNTISDGTFLAKYIVAIYTFGAGFAGIVAMLMLVIAGWKWLMAGGNAQKIIEAKGTITGALLGLAILFGGQLLLRQISENFASIQSLDIESRDLREEMVSVATYCSSVSSEDECRVAAAGCLWQDNTCILNEELSCDLTRDFITSREASVHCCRYEDYDGNKYKYATFSIAEYNTCNLCQEFSENWVIVAKSLCVEHLGY